MDLERRWWSSWGLALLSIESTERDDLLPQFLPGDVFFRFQYLLKYASHFEKKN